MITPLLVMIKIIFGSDTLSGINVCFQLHCCLPLLFPFLGSSNSSCLFLSDDVLHSVLYLTVGLTAVWLIWDGCGMTESKAVDTLMTLSDNIDYLP